MLTPRASGKRGAGRMRTQSYGVEQKSRAAALILRLKLSLYLTRRGLGLLSSGRQLLAGTCRC